MGRTGNEATLEQHETERPVCAAAYARTYVRLYEYEYNTTEDKNNNKKDKKNKWDLYDDVMAPRR